MNQDQSSQPTKLPAKPLHNPLSADDEVALNYVLSRLPVVEDMLARAHACGLDVVERGARHETHVAVATALKQHFFPDSMPTASE